MLRVGLDIGNAAVKLVGPYAGQRLMIPHALAPADGVRRDPGLVQAGMDPVEALHLEIQSPAVGVRQVFVGALAAREYPFLATEAAEGELKSASDRHLLLAIAALAAAAQQGRPATTVVPLAVATALPVAEVMEAENRQRLRERLRGRHQVRWLTTPGWAGHELILDIQEVDVIPEAAAGYLALLEERPEILTGTTLVVDVGARSLDWAVFAPGGQFRLGLSGGTMDGGLQVAADALVAAARQRHGPHVARHRQDVLEALQGLVEDGNGKVILYGLGRKHDVTDLAIRELDRLAREVARFVVQAARAGRAEHIVLIGGGGAILEKFLRRVSDIPVHVPQRPVWANAEGLYRRAQQVVVAR